MADVIEPQDTASVNISENAKAESEPGQTKSTKSTPALSSRTPAVIAIDERSLILLILLLGALGANLHGIVSLGNYIGNGTFDKKWTHWYIMRPFVGAILSFIVFLTIKAGFLESAYTREGFYTLVAVSGLVGLFSKQALNKLSDLFDTIFASRKEEQLANKMDSTPKPHIDSIEPAEISKGGESAELQIRGAGFNDTSEIRIGKETIKPESVQNDLIKCWLPESFLQDAKPLQITVYNPPPEGGESNAVEIKIT